MGTDWCARGGCRDGCFRGAALPARRGEPARFGDLGSSDREHRGGGRRALLLFSAFLLGRGGAIAGVAEGRGICRVQGGRKRRLARVPVGEGASSPYSFP